MKYRFIHSCILIIFFIFSWLLFETSSSLDNGNNRYFGQYVGSFNHNWNNIITGDVYFVNKHTLFLYNFSFNGQESDVYFKVGGHNDPNIRSNTDGIIIPDELGRFHQLGRYRNQNILLTLPKGISADKIRWISLWSKRLLKSLAEIRIVKTIAVPELKSLGPLINTKDSVKAKNIFAIDDKTILIRKFHYNINCLRCGFFVGYGAIPNSFGIKIPDEHASFSKLRNYYNEDIILRLPRDLSLINNIDWFAIYDPEHNKCYGYIRIDKKNLNIPPSMAFMLTYVTLFSNCEQILPGLMHISWEIRHPDIYIQLEARIASNQYAAFGLSGSFKQSKMIGSDVFVTYYDADSNKVVLEDFTVTGKTQCNLQTGIGVCPDTLVGGNNDLELLMSSYIDGLIKVTFRRSISVMRDHQNDLPFLIHDPNPIVAAIGTLDTHKNPSYHTVAVNTKYHQSKYRPMTIVNFGRKNPKRNCYENLWDKVINEPANIFNTIANSQVSETEIIYELRPWKPAIIKTTNNHVFHVVIGPAGNAQQGYTSITGQESPGIAFWINDLLIPELHVVRGHDYTFLIETGDNRTDKKHYHPFYITDSREGGNPNNFSINHHIYAGIRFHDGIADPQPGTGRYCELIESSRVDPAFIYSIEDYRKTLRLYCGKGNVGSFRWRPDNNTPDTIFYQSFTEKNMGWKIKVTSSSSTMMTTTLSQILLLLETLAILTSIIIVLL
ncbi:hypothetical protein DERP_000831 [Dermatophagoides pteronyssinus]|uniref:Protein Skeletor n=1 Tax=Dermatophagoides pteronyssinus TaxID=6956 RepID=A0ABQ8J191_DERPT|nr:hypothetical protein DERP_000831 [Dermatophagoides pteronyssinus]